MSQKQPRYSADVQCRAAEQVLHHHRPITQVARQLQCSPQSVKNWINKHHQSTVTRSSPPPTSHTTFLPLQVGDTDLVMPKIELVTRKGLILRFPAETPTENLCVIIQQLEASPC